MNVYGVDRKALVSVVLSDKESTRIVLELIGRKE